MISQLPERSTKTVDNLEQNSRTPTAIFALLQVKESMKLEETGTCKKSEIVIREFRER